MPSDKPADSAVARMSFEEALAALEDVVNKLESGKVPLEESIELYTRGDALREHCERKLRDAELKVERIVAKPGAGGEATVDTAPFDPK